MLSGYVLCYNLAMQIFDLYNENLDGTKLIEASAGTGKTFTLSGLYVRYIVEKKLLPENILVLTFTKAATAELRTRLRLQLIECKEHLNGTKIVDKEQNPQLFELYERYKNSEDALKYVNLSLICFDHASIYTINSFCQKIIDDFNSDCGSPVFQELINTKQYVKKYVYEFWRIQQKNTPQEFLNAIPNIDEVINKISELLNKSHYQQIKPEIDWYETENLYREYWNLSKKWQLKHQALLDYILSGDFHGGTYKKPLRENYSQDMLEFFNGLSGNVLKFCASYIESKLLKKSTLKPMPEFFKEFEAFYEKVIYTYKVGKTGNNLATSYLCACFQYVVDQLDNLLSEKGMYDYSDQIKVVHHAVTKNQNLVDKITSQWHCVMVDEFQDTDSRQLEIFNRCFNNGHHNLIYVGDPKQAIYDFRGADVFVYNQAKNQTQQQFNLITNWRSSDKMLAASNALFDYDNSFKFSWLQFMPSKPKANQQQQLQNIYAPIALIDCEEYERNKRFANELSRFLSQAHVNHKAIQPENCAILVNSNKQAIELYEYLLSVDISVSLWSDSGVFSTASAMQLYYLIRAINFPSKSNIFTALHGFFFDISLNQLQQLESEDYVAEFIYYRLESQNSDLLKAIEQLFLKKEVYSRLLKRIDGERHYTDLQHLMELLQDQIELGQNANQLEQWLAVQIQQEEFIQEDDAQKRRVESDGKKISIMTVHKSKGLEFDHVFIPYADKIKNNVPKNNINIRACLATHDENGVGQLYWKHSRKAATSFDFERRAEKVRNLYVAITRAKHCVYIGLNKNAKDYENLPIRHMIQQIEEDNTLLSLVQDSPLIPSQTKKSKIHLAEPMQFTRTIYKPQSIYSFSGLSKKQSISYEITEAQSEAIDFSNYFEFPKGSKSGTMQHEILENLVFDADYDAIQTEVIKQLQRNHFDSQWQTCLTQQIHQILNTALWKNGPKMSDITHSVDEMEFMLPIKSIANTKISQWLSQHRNSPTHFNQENLKGYLTGFIDLVFEYDNQYYVVDYKSNFLGANFSDYASENLKTAIQHHYYDLQYLLYCVALIKYLQITLDGFDYKKHFGGVAYLFTRGINGQAGQGVYFNQPDQKLIEEMVGEFNGE
ncbi:MAG: UvrD-helicase domain-containing protein [Marinicellaceae bacterium]